nr:hypothetical protein [Tanacetum cinerariifolium]
GAAPRRPWLSAPPVPLAARQPTHRRIWRVARQPDALPARGVRRRPRRLPGRPPGDDARLGHRLGRGRLGR